MELHNTDAIISIFWFSRHDPTPEQVAGLWRYVSNHFYPVNGLNIRKVDLTVKDGAAAAAEWRGEPVIVAVMPPTVLYEFIGALSASSGPAAVAHILLPRSKRERAADGGVSFVYDGFDRVRECRFHVEHVD